MTLPASRPSQGEALRYGALGLPLAFAALPLYVQWPAHAATHWGLPLAGLGVLLLLVRLADAFVDPWIGQRADRWFGSGAQRAWVALGAAALLLLAGVSTLFLAAPPAGATAWTLAAVALIVTSLGYSIGQIVHQAWGARLGGGASGQARWVGARESLALVGVLAASLLPAFAGWTATLAVLAVASVSAWALLRRIVPPAAPSDAAPAAAGPQPPQPSPWQDPAFRRLLAVQAVGGLASAIPATLVLFFMRDVLQLSATQEGSMLGLYFAAAALGMPLWARIVDRIGLHRSWALGMALAIMAFVGAAGLQAGDTVAFALVCAASGLALGADLVAGPALLALLGGPAGSGAGGAAGAGQRFGWWNLVGKLNLALAAGLALPLLQGAGYVPGDRSGDSLWALTLAYALLPCLIKGLALLLLWRTLP
jgi:glycoside/pentoside/hexuronide:cation symporter, GPH family